MSKILLVLVFLCLVNSNESRALQNLDDVIWEYEKNGVSSRMEENAGLFEGDIVIDEATKRYLIGGDIISRDAIVVPTYYWPDGVLYYMFDENLTPNTVDMIEKGMYHLKERTCIKFEKISPGDKRHKSYVKFISGNGCYSRIGRDPDNKEQVISIGSGCERIGTVVHEIMHALGFFHEHTRPDRDKYVSIDWSNIRKEHADNFKKYSRYIGSSFGKPYDYESLMHYSKEAFCLDCNKPTITPTDELAVIGQRIGLSHYDREEVNNLYKCKEDCVDAWSPYECILLKTFTGCRNSRLVDACRKSCNRCGTRKRRIKASKVNDSTTREKGASY